MMYSFITEHKPSSLSVKRACSTCSLSRSGYFKHLQSQKQPKKLLQTQEQVVKAFDLHKRLYGYRKVYAYLLKTDNSFSQDQVRGIFNKQGLKAKTVKAFKPCTTQSKHKATISKRLFKSEETVVRAMNQVWGSDITYLSVIGQSFLYLVIFLDFYSRRLVSWEISSSLSGSFVLKAFNRAAETRFVKEGLILHSDRGVQYTSRGFRSRVEELGFVQSMSRKGNCYDNAYCESFFSLLKRELGPKVYESMEEAKEDIFEWIEGWYNTKRLHSALGYRSPVEFEKIMTNTS